ncbi:MAG: IS1595 family transposase [Chloroflexi bacterium]|nr:IS1595 family transposase [Chloroflexota bacterium]
MTQKAPGRHYRDGISLLELADMFPDENAAREWFECILWPNDERPCARCGSVNTHEANHKTMPYRCRDCKKYFSVKTGTVMEGSPLPLRKWVYAIYLDVTSLKGVSSMKLHRDLKITQKAAWHMQQRIREAFSKGPITPFAGPVEVDETYIGGKRKNMPKSRRNLLTGRGAVGKTAVAGIRDRNTGHVVASVVASVVERTDGSTLRGFIHERTQRGATIYTDDARAYQGLPNHQAVKHSVGEYVNGQAHTNGLESFWATLKRGYHGTFHHFSAKHVQRYVNEFAGRHNIRDRDTVEQMAIISRGMVGKRLRYRELISNG